MLLNSTLLKEIEDFSMKFMSSINNSIDIFYQKGLEKLSSREEISMWNQIFSNIYYTPHINAELDLLNPSLPNNHISKELSIQAILNIKDRNASIPVSRYIENKDIYIGLSLDASHYFIQEEYKDIEKHLYLHLIRNYILDIYSKLPYKIFFLAIEVCLFFHPELVHNEKYISTLIYRLPIPKYTDVDISINVSRLIEGIEESKSFYKSLHIQGWQKKLTLNFFTEKLLSILIKSHIGDTISKNIVDRLEKIHMDNLIFSGKSFLCIYKGKKHVFFNRNYTDCFVRVSKSDEEYKRMLLLQDLLI